MYNVNCMYLILMYPCDDCAFSCINVYNKDDAFTTIRAYHAPSKNIS